MRMLIVVSVCVFALVAAQASGATTPRTCSYPDQPKCTIVLSTGITMRYHEVGPSDGPVVFLLHGYTDTSRSLSLVMRALHVLQPQLDLIAPDLRGDGDSSLPAGPGCPPAPDTCFRPIDSARDVVAFMDQRHIKRATVVGHSMGTLVAQELGLSFPQRVDKLVLISTATDGQSEPPLGDLFYGLISGVWEPAFLAAGYTWPDGVYPVPGGHCGTRVRRLRRQRRGPRTRSPTPRSSRRSCPRRRRRRSGPGSAGSRRSCRRTTRSGSST